MATHEVETSTWRDPWHFDGDDPEIDTIVRLARTGWTTASIITETIHTYTRFGPHSSHQELAGPTAQLIDILIHRGMAPGTIIDGRFIPWPGTWPQRCARSYQHVLDHGPINDDDALVIGNVALLPVQHFIPGPHPYPIPEHAPLESDPDILQQWLTPLLFANPDDEDVNDQLWFALSDWSFSFHVNWIIRRHYGKNVPVNAAARAAAEITGIFIDRGVAPGDLVDGDLAPWHGTREQRMNRVYQYVLAHGGMSEEVISLVWGNAALIHQGDHSPGPIGGT